MDQRGSARGAHLLCEGVATHASIEPGASGAAVEAAIAPDATAVASEAAVVESRNPFRSPRFTRWWLASLVAGTGVGIQAVTVAIFIRDRVDLAARASAIAGALIAQSLPGALLALFGGTVADRIERRRILARTYTVAAVVSVVYVLLSAADARAIWPIFVLGAIVGAAGAFTNPARQSMLPLMVTRAQLQNGVILGTMGFMATFQFLGPMIGGVLTDVWGLTIAFVAEVLLLAVAAYLFSGIRTEAPPRSGAGVVADLLEGVHYVVRRRELLFLVLLAVIPGVFFMGPFAVTVPIVVPDVFRASDRWVGILWGCFGSGLLLCSIALTFKRFRRRGFAVCASTAAAGTVLIVYSRIESLLLAVPALLVWGACAAVFINYVVALLQEQTEPRMMGRVMSMYSLVFFVAAPIGYAQAGAVTSLFGPQATLFSSGICATALGLASVLLLKPVRELE